MMNSEFIIKWLLPKTWPQKIRTDKDKEKHHQGNIHDANIMQKHLLNN